MSRSRNRAIGAAVGTVYLLVGIFGFSVTSNVGLFDSTGGQFLGLFEVNIFHNVVHLLTGAILLIAGLSTTSAAKAVNGTVGVIFLVLAVAGLLLVGTSANFLALNAADNVLHFASAAVLLAVALGTDRRGRA